MNGDYYEGEWQAGLRHGRGMQQCADGSNYVSFCQYCLLLFCEAFLLHCIGGGSFRRFTIVGCTSIAEAMCMHAMQVGDYVNGQREGYGVYVFPNGDRYEGECSGDLPDGHGVYRFQVSGAVCEGAWRAGAKHGYFIITVGCKQSCGKLS